MLNLISRTLYRPVLIFLALTPYYLIDASHTPRRRMWDRAFTIASLKEYEPMVLERISELCTQMDRLEGTVIDMNKWMGYLVFDGKFVFTLNL